MKSALFAVTAVALAASAAVVETPAPAAGAPVVDRARLMADVKVLSADDMKGRLVGTPESAKARAYVMQRLREAGLTPAERPFAFDRKGEAVQGVNVWAVIRGTAAPEKYVVVTAHYDHVGVKNGQIHNGADDNASGTAALISLAERFRAQPPRHSILLVATDAEEGGLRGAKALMVDPPVDKAAMLVDVNLDMVARGDKGELYAAGTYHSPALRPVLEAVAKTAPLKLLLGHDRPEQGPNDWTKQSDHAAFHAVGIPFVYFGVEDHPDYHQPTDDIEKIDADFYARSVRTIGDAVAALDAADAALAEARASTQPHPVQAGLIDNLTGMGKWQAIALAAVLGLSLGLLGRALVRAMLRKRA